MRSTLGEGTPVQARRAWQAPAVTELPIRTQTRVAAQKLPAEMGEPENPPPATPATKLGFAFEMSLPLSVRTE